MLPVSTSRRPYTTFDYKYLAQHYHTQPAADCAKHLGRTRASLYEFVARHPELRKHVKS